MENSWKFSNFPPGKVKFSSPKSHGKFHLPHHFLKKKSKNFLREREREREKFSYWECECIGNLTHTFPIWRSRSFGFPRWNCKCGFSNGNLDALPEQIAGKARDKLNRKFLAFSFHFAYFWSFSGNLRNWTRCWESGFLWLLKYLSIVLSIFNLIISWLSKSSKFPLKLPKFNFQNSRFKKFASKFINYQTLVQKKMIQETHYIAFILRSNIHQ